MDIENLRSHLADIIKEYFSGAELSWSEQSNAKAPKPFIKLKLGGFKIPQHYIDITTISKSTRYIPTTCTLELQLFTHGKKVIDNDGYVHFENTAVSDLMEFIMFINSDYCVNKLMALDISINTIGDCTDISAVLDNNYEYRAMQEFTVGFTQTSEGAAGIKKTNWTQSASGGGTQALADMELSYLDRDKILIEAETEDEE